MKYIFRGLVVFEYQPEKKEVVLVKDNGMANWDMCQFITEDWKLLSKFFETVHRHRSGEQIELKDIEVY